MPTRRQVVAGLASAAALPARAAGAPSLIVDPPAALEDRMLHIRGEGFAAGQPVTLVAAMTARGQSRWQSNAIHLADAAGSFDLGAGLAAMRPVWAMTEIGPPLPGRVGQGVRQPVTVEFTATDGQGGAARATATRMLAGVGVTFRPLAEATGLKGGWWLPPGAGQHPAVIVLGGSGGGADHDRAALYASHGFAALALAYFGVAGLPPVLADIPLEYFGRAIAHARSVAGDFVAVEGISRGAELALLVGATFPEVRAVLSIMGSGLVMGPFGVPDGSTASAWTLGGRPVPDLFAGNPMVDWSASDSAMSLVPGYRSAMRDDQAVARATIAVERINGPVMLVTGGDDRLAPRFDLSEIARARLERAGHRWPVVHLTYAEAGHTLAPPWRPTTQDGFVHPVSGDKTVFGGTPEGRAAANADWWPRALAFLADAVKGR